MLNFKNALRFQTLLFRVPAHHLIILITLKTIPAFNSFYNVCKKHY